MKNKGLSVLLSFVLVLVLTVSFSVPVMASSVTTGHIDIDTKLPNGYRHLTYKDGVVQIADGLSSDLYYKVNYTLDFDIVFSDNFKSSFIDYMYVIFRNKYVIPSYKPTVDNGVSSHTFNSEMILKGSEANDPNSLLRFAFFLVNTSGDLINIDIDYTLTVNSIEVLSNSESQDYEAGYNAGYSAGEESGYSSGYSSGYEDGVNSVDQDAIYDQGFQAGADSVDTQSYYDAGYNAGYSFGQLEGFELGYESGYNDAMDRFGFWGADTSEYPILLDEVFHDVFHFEFLVPTYDELPRSDLHGTYVYSIPNEINPNHTYKIVFQCDNYEFYRSSVTFYDSGGLYINVGGCFYPISIHDDKGEYFFYVPGNRMSNSLYLESYFYGCHSYDSISGVVRLSLYDYSIKCYDMGPSGDTQNHIANQTDQLTNGYDSSSITSSNTALSGSIAEFTGAESQITDQSFGFIDQVQFYDLNMQPQLLACITFCSSWLQSLFVNIGDWGILVMVSLSLGFGLMLIGWFKYRRK